MNPTAEAVPLRWEGAGTSRIPFAAYTDEQRHREPE